MSTHKKIDVICVVVMICALILTILFMNGEKLGLQLKVDEDARKEANAYFTANDLDGAWDTSSATRITLNGDSAKISGNGAYVLDGDLVIAETGWFILEGSLSDGSIIVDAHKTSKVWIQLNGVDVHCSDNAAFLMEKADKVFLTLAEGTENVFESGAEYSTAAQTDLINGAVFARDDLTINGSGSLTVTAGYKHGIVAKDDLTITGGTINIKAENDGIRTNDSFCFCDASLTIDAKDDGIVQEKEDFILYVASGTIDITCEGDALNAVSEVVIDGGTTTINAEDDGIHSDVKITINDGEVLVNECYEGLESKIIEIHGGNTELYPSDDGINANGGTFEFGMMGGPGDSEDGESEEGESPEGEGPGEGDSQEGEARPEGDSQEGQAPAEGESPEGETPVETNAEPTKETVTEAAEEPAEETATEAAKEASEELVEETATETASEASEEPAGETATEAVEEPVTEAGDEPVGEAAPTNAERTVAETYVWISGGNLTIVNPDGQDADGIDSNGDIYITGGNVRISLLNSGTNSAIDYASEGSGVCEITGGTVVAAGSYMMAEQFDSTSTQCSILYTYSKGAQSGSTVSVSDKDGNVILTWDVPCSFSSINLSCPEMQLGETYYVLIEDNLEEITLENVSAAYGDAQSGGFGGPMNFGGMSPFGNSEGGESEGSEQAGEQAGQQGESQEGESQEGESQEGERQDSEGQQRQEGESQEGESQEGERQDSEGQERQEGESQEGDQQDSEGAEQQGESEEGQQGESEEGQQGESEDVQQEQSIEAEQLETQSIEGEQLEGESQEGQPGESEEGQPGESEGGQPGESEGGQPGESEGGQPGESEGGQPGDSRGGQRDDTSDIEEETTVSNRIALSELDSTVWVWLGISVVVIIGGLLLVFFYRRGRL